MSAIDYFRNRQKVIWLVFVIILIAGTISVFTKQQKHHQKSTIKSILMIRDSIKVANYVHRKENTVLGLLEVIRQRQTITALMQKDSLTPTDQLRLKQMDQQLNTLLHESN